ncbi:MAG: hypothetical protein ABI353_06225 [Isosphaeraceae bacterium]
MKPIGALRSALLASVQQPASVWLSMITVGLAMAAIFDARVPSGLRALLALGILFIATVGLAWMTFDGLVGWLRSSGKLPSPRFSTHPDQATHEHPLWDSWLDS